MSVYDAKSIPAEVNSSKPVELLDGIFPGKRIGRHAREFESTSEQREAKRVPMTAGLTRSLPGTARLFRALVAAESFGGICGHDHCCRQLRMIVIQELPLSACLRQ